MPAAAPLEIRKYILENDLLEAIIALPNDIFYNTGIATYIWVLSNKKGTNAREGKVQLINANGLYEKRRKALGNKRNDIPENAIAESPACTATFGERDRQDFDTRLWLYQNHGGAPAEGRTVSRCSRRKPQPDTALRDTENVPLKEDIGPT